MNFHPIDALSELFGRVHSLEREFSTFAQKIIPLEHWKSIGAETATWLKKEVDYLVKQVNIAAYIKSLVPAIPQSVADLLAAGAISIVNKELSKLQADTAPVLTPQDPPIVKAQPVSEAEISAEEKKII